jgi:phosphatidylglycerophosphatase GEP4
MIQAEAVSLSLECPVLLHPIPKPGCANLVIDYFAGSLGSPTTVRSQMAKEAEALRRQEEEDERYMIGHLEALVDGPLLGPLVDKNGKEVKPQNTKIEMKEDKGENRELEQRMTKRQREAAERKAKEKSEQDAEEKAEAKAVKSGQMETKETRTREALRILVIGDRLFTDTLLANRISLLLKQRRKRRRAIAQATGQAPVAPASPPVNPIPHVVSIHTTLLPQPKDVRLLRYIEDKLTRGRLRQGNIDFGRYVIDNRPVDVLSKPARSWRERINPFRDTPPLTLDPRSWRPAPLVVGLGHGLFWVSSKLWAGIVLLVKKIWAGEVDVAKALAEKTKTGEKKVELAVSEVARAEKEALSKT